MACCLPKSTWTFTLPDPDPISPSASFARAASVMSFKGTLDYFIQGVFNYPAFSDAYKYAAYDGLQALARRRARVGGLPSTGDQRAVRI